jgi:hypothetical protein
MGGVTLPLSQDIGNSLFNNPAALSHNTKLRAEFLDVDGDLGSQNFSAFGQGMTGLGGLSGQLNSNPNKTYSQGISNVSAVSWGGFGIGVLYQNRSNAYSDGTTAHYQTLVDLVPAVGYGVSLARGVLRLGYSLQYVNEASGIAQAPSNSSASYLSGLGQGHGFSSTVSANLIMPVTYLPTFSVIGRNLGGLHFSGGNLISQASNVNGLPADQPSSVDAAFNWTVRLSGTVKSFWFFEYDDVSNTANLPVLERMRFGVELDLSPSFNLRVGTTGGQFSGGIGYRSESSEINLAMYQDRSPFATNGYWDTRYALQYKVFLQSHNTRDREAEEKRNQQ